MMYVAVANPSRGCSMMFEGLPNARRPLMVRAALLRRSCDGVAAAQLRRAHSARRVRDGADAAAPAQMLRAALLRRSCDGVAAATELRRPAPSFPPVLIYISMVWPTPN